MVNVNARVNARCTCPPTPGHPEADGVHTSGVAPSITQEVLAVLIDDERCPVEKRALERIYFTRARIRS